MKIILIGGTGNISFDCAEEMLKHGHTVYTVTRGMHPAPEGAIQLKADRNNAGQLKEVLHGIKADAAVDFLGFTPADMQIDIDVLSGRTDQLVFISSATVYAKPHRDLPITEDHPVGNRFSEYARNKEACEDFLRNQSRLPVTIVRPSHTFSRTWLPNCVKSAGYTFAERFEQGLPVFVPGDGSMPWTLTSAEDFAKGLYGLLGNSRALGETFHITGDEHPSWKEIYEMTAELAGAQHPQIEEIPVDFICDVAPRLTAGIKGDKCEPAVFDNSKVKSVVPGFQCSKTVRQAIEESINWMKEHPEDKNIDPAVHKTFDSVVTAWRSRSAG